MALSTSRRVSCGGHVAAELEVLDLGRHAAPRPEEVLQRLPVAGPQLQRSGRPVPRLPDHQRAHHDQAGDARDHRVAQPVAELARGAASRAGTTAPSGPARATAPRRSGARPPCPAGRPRPWPAGRRAGWRSRRTARSAPRSTPPRSCRGRRRRRRVDPTGTARRAAPGRCAPRRSPTASAAARRRGSPARSCGCSGGRSRCPRAPTGPARRAVHASTWATTRGVSRRRRRDISPR